MSSPAKTIVEPEDNTMEQNCNSSLNNELEMIATVQESNTKDLENVDVILPEKIDSINHSLDRTMPVNSN